MGERVERTVERLGALRAGAGVLHVLNSNIGFDLARSDEYIFVSTHIYNAFTLHGEVYKCTYGYAG